MNICFAQLEVQPGLPQTNFAKALKALGKAEKEKADLILFPEMLIPGYLLG
ncbi:MAG: hypothetical protein HQL32_13990, partial [Planctomycetes bacterium]|nr:hypothetical protein [Planctomycetota bacterium]